MKTQKLAILLLIALLSSFAATSSRAESYQFDDDEWHFVAPLFYMWLFQTDGNLLVKGKSIDTDLSIGDVLEDTDTNFQLYLEANKGNWGISVEPSFLSFSTETKTGGFKFDNSVDIMIVDTAVSYRVWHTKDPKRMSVYAVAGVRYWNFDTGVDGKGAAAPDGNAHLDVIDPVLGGKFRMDVTEKFHVGARFDVGGFGLTDRQSHFTWQAWGLANYDVTKHFSVFGGYRGLGLDYDLNHGSQKKGADVDFFGPVLGLNFDIFGWLADRKK